MFDAVTEAEGFDILLIGDEVKIRNIGKRDYDQLAQIFIMP